MTICLRGQIMNLKVTKFIIKKTVVKYEEPMEDVLFMWVSLLAASPKKLKRELKGEDSELDIERNKENVNGDLDLAKLSADLGGDPLKMKMSQLSSALARPLKDSNNEVTNGV